MGINRHCCLLFSIPAFFLSLSLVITTAGCGGGSPSSIVPPPAKTLTSVSVSPSSASISAGSTEQFQATAKYSDGSTADVTSSATWAAASQSVATVSGGLAKGVASGSTSVTATLTGMSGSAMLSVAAIAPTVTAIVVTPPNPSISTGSTEQFSATASYSDGSIGIVTSTATWTSATTSVATISSSGLATGVAAGSSVITAAVGAVSGTTSLTVTPQISSITITPATAGTYVGDTDQFTATATYSNGTTGNVTSTATWTSATTSVATISSSGLATGVAVGTSAITAALGGVTSTVVTLTVQAKTVTSIAVAPPNASTYTTDTEQFSATATYNDGSTASVTSTATWSTTPSTIATISASGLATGVVAGSTTVTAAIGTITGTAMLTVQTKALTSITVAPTNPNVAESGTLQFGATGTYNDGSTANVTSSVTWLVDHVTGGNSADGTITTAGLYTAPSSSGTETITATSPNSSSITASATVTVANAPQGAVLTYHNDDARDGAYTQEVTLMPSNVNSTTFGKLYAYPVNGQIMGQPLYMPQMSIAGGTSDVVFVATENNYVYAFNADATSSATAQIFWQLPLGAPVSKSTNVNAGVQSTPVIDPSTNTIYLVAEKTGYSNPFWLYALNAATGVNQPGSPVNITATYNGDSLESSCDQRVGLALDPVSNAVYIGFGDCTHGWVLAYDKTTLAQIAVLDDTNGGSGGGLWSSGGAPAIDDTTGNLYLLTGVDENDPVTIGYNDSFLALDPTNLSILTYFTPDNNSILSGNDADLAAGGNILVPSSSLGDVTLGGGKDGNIYVVNRDDMGGYSTTTNNVIQTLKTGSGNSNDTYDNIFSTPVFWNNLLYFHCNDDVLRSFSWNPANTSAPLAPAGVGSNVYEEHGATASLSANGTLNGIVWDIDNTAFSNSNPADGGPAVLHAYNATNVAVELYNTTQAASGRDTAGAASKFTAPTVAGGKVFVPTSVELDIYGLLP